MPGLLSKATVAAVGLTCKAFMTFGFCPVHVKGLPTLIAALESSKRNNGQGIVTVSNHISTLDDPVTWGVLPARYYLNSRTTRWALGASEIMFTNPVFSTIFRLGQTIETFRGKGIYQPAVDATIDIVNDGGWVHLYGEGKVNQPATYPVDEHGLASLPRFKWGVGRILMEANIPPVIIPMWLTGFDKLMPEGRPFPYKFLPRWGARLSVTFGDPISPDELLRALAVKSRGPISPEHQEKRPGWIGAKVAQMVEAKEKDVDTAKIRSEVTAIIQREVQNLGRSVAGSSLSDIPSSSH